MNSENNTDLQRPRNSPLIQNLNTKVMETSLLKVALVGRPNVGKSSLFNYLTRTRDAVVKDEPGVTRDIKKGMADWWGNEFYVFDTGGVTDGKDTLFELVKQQVLQSLDSMDLIVFLMDGRDGLTHEDRSLLQIIKRANKPFKAVINKIDRMQDVDMIVGDFYKLGLDEFMPISVEHQTGIEELVEWIATQKKPVEDLDVEQRVRIAIVGKPNVGKSSLVNCIFGEQKQVVFDQPGTTVDFVDHDFDYNDQKYTLIDTAGLRRQSKREDGIEYLSAVKSYDAIRRSDIMLLVVDAQEGPSKQDAKIIEHLIENHKAVILVFNKSDLARKDVENYRQVLKEKLQRELHFFDDIRFAFTSAVTGQGVRDLFQLIEKTWNDLNIKIPTSKLNQFFTDVIRQAPAPVFHTRDVKFYYLTQTQQRPPSFIAFANFPDGVTPAYRRFLAKRIKEEWDIQGIPIRIFAMKRTR
jgi:GTPase